MIAWNATVSDNKAVIPWCSKVCPSDGKCHRKWFSISAAILGMDAGLHQLPHQVLSIFGAHCGSAETVCIKGLLDEDMVALLR